jgi:hypothetical protein
LYKDIAAMLKCSFYTLASLLLLVFQRDGCGDAVPKCVQEKIEQIKKEPPRSVPAEVHEYVYNGKRVFYFNSDCCDQFNLLYDEHCNYICAPDGGLTGKGDRKCDDFKSASKHVRQIWKDDRTN